MPGQAIYDKEDVSFNLARMKKAGLNFEIVIDPDNALAYREGRLADIREALKSENVFSDAKKGLIAPEGAVKQVFGTNDGLEVASTIIKDGEIQLTAEHRKRFRDQKRKIIVELIRKNGVDPKTNLPHPGQRIESAMDEAKIKIDEFKKAEEQVPGIVKQIQTVLPVRISIAEIAINIPDGQTAMKAYNTIKTQSTILREEWGKLGGWNGTVEVPAGLTEELFAKISKITKGEADMRVVKNK